MSVRLAHCANEIESDGPNGVLIYENCPGMLSFRPEDRHAACPVCGASCGSLVADYIEPEGPWPEAIERWHAEVEKARRA